MFQATIAGLMETIAELNELFEREKEAKRRRKQHFAELRRFADELDAKVAAFDRRKLIGVNRDIYDQTHLTYTGDRTIRNFFSGVHNITKSSARMGKTGYNL